jgi:hypothetical protein
MFLYKMTNVNSDHRGYSFTISKMRNYCKIGSYYFGPELLDTSSDAENSFFLSCCRYLLILFRDAPVEVWAMTKHPVMLRSLALPFTVVEWTLPAVPRPGQGGPSKQSLSASEGVTASGDSSSVGSDGSQEETVESFAFALVNGALGVFEVQGRRIRDFR